MKLKYIGLYLFPFILPLPVPMLVSTLALFLMILNLLVLDYKNIDLKKTIRNPYVLLCVLFFSLDFLRAVFTMSFDGKLIHEVRLAFVLIPLLFLNKQGILMQELRNMLRCFMVGVFVYITIAWSYVIYYYEIAHPTYVFEFTDYYLIYVLSHEFSIAIHHTYIGMYIALSAIILFLNTIHYKTLSAKIGIPLVGLLLVNSFFIGSKLSTGILMLCLFLIAVFNVLKFSNFKKAKYYFLGFFAIVAFGLYSIREWLLFTITKSFDARVSYLKKSMSVISDNLFLGIGKDELLKTPLNEANAELGRLIPHNMFVYETIVHGLMGTIVLLLLLGFLMRKAIQSRALIVIFFLVLIIVTGLVEDILMRQRGVFFFIFFMSLFYIYAERYKVNKEEINI